MLLRRLGYPTASLAKKVCPGSGAVYYYSMYTHVLLWLVSTAGGPGLCPLIHDRYSGDVDHLGIPALLVSFAARDADCWERLLLALLSGHVSHVPSILAPACAGPRAGRQLQRARQLHPYLFRLRDLDGRGGRKRIQNILVGVILRAYWRCCGCSRNSNSVIGEPPHMNLKKQNKTKNSPCKPKQNPEQKKTRCSICLLPLSLFCS